MNTTSCPLQNHQRLLLFLFLPVLLVLTTPQMAGAGWIDDIAMRKKAEADARYKTEMINYSERLKNANSEEVNQRVEKIKELKRQADEAFSQKNYRKAQRLGDDILREYELAKAALKRAEAYQGTADGARKGIASTEALQKTITSQGPQSKQISENKMIDPSGSTVELKQGNAAYRDAYNQTMQNIRNDPDNAQTYGKQLWDDHIKSMTNPQTNQQTTHVPDTYQYDPKSGANMTMADQSVWSSEATHTGNYSSLPGNTTGGPQWYTPSPPASGGNSPSGSPSYSAFDPSSNTNSTPSNVASVSPAETAPTQAQAPTTQSEVPTTQASGAQTPTTLSETVTEENAIQNMRNNFENAGSLLLNLFFNPSYGTSIPARNAILPRNFSPNKKGVRGIARKNRALGNQILSQSEMERQMEISNE